MKKVMIFIVASLLLTTAQAKTGDEDDLKVILPDDAQACVLPSAPDAIAPDADYDQLIAAKGSVAEFQTMLETYRNCLHDAEKSSDLTTGNEQALTASYNYSVDMEERVAERFNQAVRNYKERTAEK